MKKDIKDIEGIKSMGDIKDIEGIKRRAGFEKLCFQVFDRRRAAMVKL